MVLQSIYTQRPCMKDVALGLFLLPYCPPRLGWRFCNISLFQILRYKALFSKAYSLSLLLSVFCPSIQSIRAGSVAHFWQVQTLNTRSPSKIDTRTLAAAARQMKQSTTSGRIDLISMICIPYSPKTLSCIPGRCHATPAHSHRFRLHE